MISANDYDKFLASQKLIEDVIKFLQSKTIGQIPTLRDIVTKNNATLYDYLKRPEIKLMDLMQYLPFDINDSNLISKIEIKVKFSGYINSQDEKIEQYKKMKDYDLTEIQDFKTIPNLPLEAIDKLNKIKPLTLSQAGRISGINIEDILKIKYYLDTKH